MFLTESVDADTVQTSDLEQYVICHKIRFIFFYLNSNYNSAQRVVIDQSRHKTTTAPQTKACK